MEGEDGGDAGSRIGKLTRRNEVRRRKDSWMPYVCTQYTQDS